MTASKRLLFLFCIASLGAPNAVFASVRITEIMYDLPGTDAGREWIEFTNMGDGPLDVTGYKFFEGNTNHALTLLSGSGVLEPQTSAVIAADQAKFMADNPSFSGTLFKASFDLSNSGETIAIKTSSTATPDDSVSYDAGAGAGGDGNSLKWNGASFIAGTPDPGVFSASSGSADTSAQPASAPSAPQSTGSSALPPQITAQVEAPSETMVGGGSFFSATAYGSAGLPLSGARYIWNFGDGATAEGARVFHAYSYPGTYAVSLTAASSLSSALSTARVTAVPAQVGLMAEGDGSLTIANRSKSDVDIGLWMLSEGPSSFIIPERTTILAGKGVRFSPTVTRVYGDESARLLYPNGALAASASPGARSPLRGEPVEIAPQSVSTTHGPQVPAPVAAKGAPAISAAAAESGFAFPLWESLLGLGALIVLGVAGAWYARPMKVAEAAGKETLPSVEEFEIEDAE